MTDSLQIGEWQVLPSARLITRGGRQLKLSPRAMDVLVYLSSRPGEVISIDELLTSLWPRTVRSPNAVAKVMTELRQALHHDSDLQLLETVPKRGYRLHASPLEHTEYGQGARTASQDDAMTDVCIICIGEHSAVVVPNASAASRSGAAYLEQQIHREIEAEARQIASATVSWTRARANLAERGLRVALHADYSISTMVEQTTSGISASLTLLPQRDDWPAHRQRFNGSTEASVELIDQVVRSAIDTLTILLDDDHRKSMHEWGTRNTAAYVALREAIPLYTTWNLRMIEKAELLLRRAIDLDPKFSPAYRWLSGAHYSFALLGGVAKRRESVRLAQQRLLNQARNQGIDIDVVRELEQDLMLISVATPTDAEIYWHTELEKDPTSVHALRRYAELLLAARLIDESERYLQRAMELSPAEDRDSLEIDEVNLSQARGQFELSVKLIKRNLERFPDHSMHLYAMVSALAKLGRFVEAQRYLDRLETISSGWAFLARQNLLALRGDLRQGSNLIGLFFADRRANNANRGITSFMIGDVDAGLRYWRQIEPQYLPDLWQFMPAHEQRWPPHVMADPRYQALLDELGFGRQWQAWMRERAIELTPVTGIEVTTPAPAIRSA